MFISLTWIPIVGAPNLPTGWFWFRNIHGDEHIQYIDPLWVDDWMYKDITHYCPVPRPQEPQEVQEGP